MLPATESALLFIFASVQVIGLISLAGARLSGTSVWHRYYCGAFLGALIAVGAATMFAITCHSGWWVSCGATLSLMSVGGTIDLGRTASAAF
jgi:hypothetical protein